MIDATTMVPVHDHFADDFDGYYHDPRCCGECGPCGGTGGIEANRCLYCWGDGRCVGCNAYLAADTHERLYGPGSDG